MTIGPVAGGFLDTEHIVAALGVVSGMHVAELGCGSGFFAISLARAVGPEGVVVAVDIMQEPLDALRARAEALGLGNIKTIRADLEVLGGTAIGDNTQNFAMLASTLFQSPKKDAMIREAIRMLKPGGHLLVIEWKKEAGTVGPPLDLRISEEDLKQLVQAQGARFDRSLDAGQFHYADIFIK